MEQGQVNGYRNRHQTVSDARQRFLPQVLFRYASNGRLTAVLPATPFKNAQKERLCSNKILPYLNAFKFIMQKLLTSLYNRDIILFERVQYDTKRDSQTTECFSGHSFHGT